jgi:leucyl-tRNA synthetase
MIVSNGAKMSKSRGNIINPDDYIKEYGADSFRMYLMFMGAYLEGGDFRDGGVRSMKSFLDRLYSAVSPPEGGALDPNPPTDRETLFWLNSTIKAVGADLARFSYNTAIARIMELVNHLTKNKIYNCYISETIAQLVAPMAPHLAEEIWEALGHNESVFKSSWPTYDEAACLKPEVEYVIQVNGKVRGKISLAAGLPQEEIEPLVLKNEVVAKWLEGKTIVKKIYVPDKLVNLVVK